MKPKTAGQKRYVDAITENVITFGIGPAGTGKSWLAVAMAVRALQAKQVQRIILTRPAVEAGERLGFLPGDLMAKIDPYLRPLYDALYDMLDPEAVQRLLEKQVVEVAPLAFMRGRTLNNSFIILDEAQNTTPEQMKMFLTRIGFGSRVVVTGDTTQIDVPNAQERARRARADADRHRRTWRSCSSPERTSCVTRSSPTSSRPTSAAAGRDRAGTESAGIDERRRRRLRGRRTVDTPTGSMSNDGVVSPSRCCGPRARTASSPYLRRRRRHRRAERRAHGRGRADRRAVVPTRRRRFASPSADVVTADEVPLLLGDVVIAPAGRRCPVHHARRHLRRRAGAAGRATVSSTWSATTTPTPGKARRCAVGSSNSWRRTTGAGRHPPGSGRTTPDRYGRRSWRSPSTARSPWSPAHRVGSARRSPRRWRRPARA